MADTNRPAGAGGTEVLRALLAAATPGPWTLDGHGATADDPGPVWVLACETIPNAALAVAAVNALPALLDVVEAAREVAERTTVPYRVRMDVLIAALDRLGATDGR